MLTVNPSSRLMRFFSLWAKAQGSPVSFSMPLISINASSMLYCSTSGVYSLSSSINFFEYSLYMPWCAGTTVSPGHFFSASVRGSPVFTPYALAEMDFARIMPLRLDLSPPTAQGISLKSTVPPCSFKR